MAELRLDLSKVDRDLQGNYDMNQFAQAVYADPLAEGTELSPLQKLKQYCQNEDPGEREMTVRSILDAVDEVKSYGDFELILEIALALANDIDPEVRSRVLSTVAVLLDKNAEVTVDGDEYRQENEERLFEIPLRMMTDFNQQVRRVSQNAIASLLEQNRAKDTFTRHLCSVMVHCLGRDENCDIKVDTLLLISRVAALLGHDLCLSHFVPVLPYLASDTMFHVRKVLAMCCRELCPVLGEETVDNSVLPLFLNLCQDEVWGVRKACAEVYTEVANSCTMETRYSLLTPAFLKLLRDDSKWVRKTAYQTLGPFISTFYNSGSGFNQSDISLEPLGDSILRENSLLDTSASLTADSSPGSREAGPSPGDREAGPSPGDREADPSPGGREADPSPGGREVGLSPVGKEIDTSPTGPREEGLGTRAETSDGNHVWGSPFALTKQSPLLAGEEAGSFTSEETLPDQPTRRQLESELGDLNNDGRDNAGVALNRTTGTGSGDLLLGAGVVSGDLLLGAGVASPPVTAVQHTGEGLEGVQSAPPPIHLEDEEDDDSDLLPFLMDLPTGKGKTGCVVGESSPIRVFVHSENGHMTEHVGSDAFEGDVSDLSPDRTCIHAVSMDLTMNGDMGGVSDTVANAFHQDIVPDELMEIYLSIMEQGRVPSGDGELQYHCAFSLPAVVQTLGRAHWQLIKPLFDLLVVDQNWKIRRVLAFSLHELAKVLGPKLMCSDLIPVLMEICTKDIDEVKIGALSHLADFFELLPVYVRVQKLSPVLHGLLDMENERNWRYRQCLAEQLASLCSMLECYNIQAHISPVALKLAEDRVAEVRRAANTLLGVILQRYFEECPDSGRGLLKTLKEHFASHESYCIRLMYVKQTELFLSEQRVPNEIFAVECLPTLLVLSKDKVSNLRLAVARVLKDTVLTIDYFRREVSVPFSPEELRRTHLGLQEDRDRDVRYFAGNTNPVCKNGEKEGEKGRDDAPQGVGSVGSEEEFFDVEAAKC